MIFKAVEKCNSNCIYCDVIKKKQDKIMDLELLELLFIRINEYLSGRPEEMLTFTWHGGEVCLLGAGYFKTALRLQKEHCPSTGSRINHQVQSNLTLINQDLIDAFRGLGITQIGSSFEPLPNIRGFGKNRNSDAYNRKFFEGVRLLEKNRMTWGVIYVVHRGSLEIPLNLFYYLTNLNIGSHPNFNQVKIFGEDKHHLGITGEEFADFLGAIFPVWWKYRHRYPDMQPFAQLVKNIRDGEKGLLCENSGDCQYNWLYIGPDGETSQCGRGGDYNILSYGNLKDFEIEELLSHPERDTLSRRQHILPEGECKDCRFWGICHGGCPLDAKMEYDDIMRRSPNCSAMKCFIEKYFEPVTGMKVELSPN